MWAAVGTGSWPSMTPGYTPAVGIKLHPDTEK